MRTVTAWLVGIVGFLLVGVGIGLLGDAMGIPPAVHHNRPIGREIGGEYSESDSSPTSFGYATMIFSAVVGVWAGRASFARSWWAGFTPIGKLTFFAWLTSAAVLLPAGAIVDLAFQHKHGPAWYYIRLLLEIVTAAGVAWACHRWWKNRVLKSEASE